MDQDRLKILKCLQSWVFFEIQYINNKPLTVIKPGTQKRKFTHVTDTVEACYFAWKENKNRLYSISSKESLSIINVAKMFSNNIKMLNERLGEKFISENLKSIRGIKLYNLQGKKNLKDYIENFKETHKKK